MANTLIPIATVTVGSGGASSIQFTSIPQTYTDLVIMLSARETLALGSTRYTDIYITINGQTSASGRVLYALGPSDYASYSPSSAPVQANGGNSTASTFSNVSIYIPNYTRTGIKSISADSVAENNASNSIITLNAFTITNGAAINSITISATTSLSSTFVQYSTATLYGIKNS